MFARSDFSDHEADRAGPRYSGAHSIPRARGRGGADFGENDSWYLAV